MIQQDRSGQPSCLVVTVLVLWCMVLLVFTVLALWRMVLDYLSPSEGACGAQVLCWSSGWERGWEHFPCFYIHSCRKNQMHGEIYSPWGNWTAIRRANTKLHSMT